MTKYSYKIKNEKLQHLYKMGLSSQDIAILLDEIKKLGDAEKKLLTD